MRTRNIITVLVILIIALSAGAAALLLYGGLPAGRETAAPTFDEQCRTEGGTWIAEYAECELASADWCAGFIGSSYDACASACRHNPDPTYPCTLQCVPVCAMPSARPSAVTGPGPGDITYTVDGNDVTLSGGVGVGPMGPVSLWGQAPADDLDGDGKADVAVILAVEEGDMYQVAVALAGADGYTGTNAVRIGSGVAMQTAHAREGRVIVNYAARHPWEGQDVQASVGRTKRLLIDGGRLVEEPREQLSSESARVIAVREWGDCTSPDCTSLTVNTIDAGDGVWYVIAEYAGLADDSIAAHRLSARVHYASDAWSLGEVLRDEQRCQPGRGHQEFSAETCI